MDRISKEQINNPNIHYHFVNGLVGKIIANKKFNKFDTLNENNEDSWNTFFNKLNNEKIELEDGSLISIDEHINNQEKFLTDRGYEPGLLFNAYKNTIYKFLTNRSTPPPSPRSGGGFIFNNTRKKIKKKEKKKKKKMRFTRKKKDRKWTDTSYPYRDVTKSEAIKDFLTLRRIVRGDLNPKSIAGNALVDWGTEKARRKTKYRNKSFIEKWKNKTRRKKLLQFAKRLEKKHKKSVLGAIRSAIDLQWGSVNTLRPAAAACMYKKYKAKRVLDFTAGWGARMIAAMALDIDYIGIDSNTDLKEGYNRIIKLLKPYTKSNVKMYFKKAEEVDFSKIGKYDYVFTSPPYEYLEAYENMKNYEGDGKIRQPSSSQKIKMQDSAKFYDEFLVPTLKKAYKYLPKNKHICLNMPDIMYDKIKKRWIPVTRKETYNIVKRTGGPHGKEKRRGKELIFCWKK